MSEMTHFPMLHCVAFPPSSLDRLIWYTACSELLTDVALHYGTEGVAAGRGGTEGYIKIQSVSRFIFP